MGMWLGTASNMEHFQGPLAKLQAKAQFLATLALTERGASTAPLGVPRASATQFFPSAAVIRRANIVTPTALLIKNWDLPTSCWQQPISEVGYDLGTVII